jgi:putative DNA primase/helicase
VAHNEKTALAGAALSNALFDYSQAIDQFKDAMRTAGLTPPNDIIMDGKIHRFSSNGKSGDDAGWYIGFGDGIPAGAYGDWRTGIKAVWRMDLDRNLTPEEDDAHKRRLEVLQQRQQEEKCIVRANAQKKARTILEQLPKAENTHPYLLKKQIDAWGIYLHDNKLIVPLHDTSGELHSLQFINAEGDKTFLYGGQIKGCFHMIGKPQAVICIAEGYATAATIYKATGYAVAVAFNANNLEPVGQALKKKFPTAQFLVCGDDDWLTVNNPGETQARKAALAIGAGLLLPEFNADRPNKATDFNDMCALYGIEAVNLMIKKSVVKSTKILRGKLDTIRGDELKMQPIRWLWLHWLVSGKLQILAGPAGTGKTTIAISLAATLTNGGRFPDQTQAQIGDVMIWSGEDDPRDTLGPRIMAAGANMARVHFINGVTDEKGPRPFDPATDVAILIEKMEQLRPVLLIIDPIVSAVAGDSHKNAETRRALQPLVDMAEKLGVALLGITHFSKGTAGRDPTERVTGSLAFGAIARVVMVAAKLENEEDGSRIFCRSKSNVGPDEGGFRYRLDQKSLPDGSGLMASCVIWGDAVKGAARDLLAEAEASSQNNEDDSAVGKAEKFLQELLLKEPVPVVQIKEAAVAYGHAWRTIGRAKKKLDIEVTKDGMRGGFSWKLPDPFDLDNSKAAKQTEECHLETMAAFDEFGILQVD